jgi:hypothetical protein
LLRGGIVRGDVYHHDRVAFGPALIAAYELERAAKYPRIVLDDSVTGIERSDHWRRDPDDGQTFFSYLTCFGALPTIYKHLICRHLLTASDRGVLEKYEWTRNYYELALGKSPPAEHSPIVVDAGDRLVLVEKGEWPSLGSGMLAREV